MLTYVYVCKGCSHTFERFQKIDDKPVRTCPECGARVERLITGGGGVLFKGKGFYCTDYRSERYKSEARKDGSAQGENREATSNPGKEKGKGKGKGDDSD